MNLQLVALALFIGLANVAAGRADDIFGKDKIPGARALFRCILPGIFAAWFAYLQFGFTELAVYIGLCVLIGSAIWFPFGWSFDEINGQYDPNKYPRFIQKIGLAAFPLDISSDTNMERGIFMKGLRGLYDFFTFALLAFFQPAILLLWTATASMGMVYYLSGVIFKESPVAWAEFIYGCIRGALIGTAITMI